MTFVSSAYDRGTNLYRLYLFIKLINTNQNGCNLVMRACVRLYVTFVSYVKIKEIIKIHFGPGNGSQWLRTLFFLFLGLLLSDFQCTKAFSFHNPLVIRLRIQIEDNILHNRTVSDFQVKFN